MNNDWANILKEEYYIENRENASPLDTLCSFLFVDELTHKAGVFFEENKANIPKEVRGDIEKFLRYYEDFEDRMMTFLERYDESYGGDSSSLTYD